MSYARRQISRFLLLILTACRLRRTRYRFLYGLKIIQVPTLSLSYVHTRNFTNNKVSHESRIQPPSVLMEFK